MGHNRQMKPHLASLQDGVKFMIVLVPHSTDTNFPGVETHPDYLTLVSYVGYLFEEVLEKVNGLHPSVRCLILAQVDLTLLSYNT